MVNLTENSIPNEADPATEKVPTDDSSKKIESQTLKKLNLNPQTSSSGNVTVFAPQRPVSRQTQHQGQTSTADALPAVTLRRLPFLETHFQDLGTSKCSIYLTKDCSQMSMCFRQLNNDSKAPGGIDNFSMTMSDGFNIDNSLDEPLSIVAEPPNRQEQQENDDIHEIAQLHDKTSLHPSDSPSSVKESLFTDPKKQSTRDMKTDCFSISVCTHLTTSPSSQAKAHGSTQREVISPNLEQLASDKPKSRQSCSDRSSSSSSTTGNNKSQVEPTSTSEHALGENMSGRQVEEVVRASNSSGFMHCGVPSEPPLSVSETENMDEGSETYRGDLGFDSPVSVLWDCGSDGEDNSEDSRFDVSFRAASAEERHFVCPVMLRKMMSGPAQTQVI